mmetsp:Transcript_41/g.111  ORF Transcript_41/g.111 Transcript_41/m.111 type:complete len:350 (+) Transcript_41:368-1417(+)
MSTGHLQIPIAVVEGIDRRPAGLSVPTGGCNHFPALTNRVADARKSRGALLNHGQRRGPLDVRPHSFQLSHVVGEMEGPRGRPHVAPRRTSFPFPVVHLCVLCVERGQFRDGNIDGQHSGQVPDRLVDLVDRRHHLPDALGEHVVDARAELDAQENLVAVRQLPHGPEGPGRPSCRGDENQDGLQMIPDLPRGVPQEQRFRAGVVAQADRCSDVHHASGQHVLGPGQCAPDRSQPGGGRLKQPDDPSDQRADLFREGFHEARQPEAPPRTFRHRPDVPQDREGCSEADSLVPDVPHRVGHGFDRFRKILDRQKHVFGQFPLPAQPLESGGAPPDDGKQSDRLHVGDQRL